MNVTDAQFAVLKKMLAGPLYQRGGGKGVAGVNGHVLNSLVAAGLAMSMAGDEAAPMISFRKRTFRARMWVITGAGRVALK